MHPLWWVLAFAAGVVYFTVTLKVARHILPTMLDRVAGMPNNPDDPDDPGVRVVALIAALVIGLVWVVALPLYAFERWMYAPIDRRRAVIEAARSELAELEASEPAVTTDEWTARIDQARVRLEELERRAPWAT